VHKISSLVNKYINNLAITQVVAFTKDTTVLRQTTYGDDNNFYWII